MEITEENSLYEEKFSVENSQTDSRRLIIYDFPDTLNENGIYNILDHIECTPTNIILMNKKSMKNADANYFVSTKTSSVAIVEFSSKKIMDQAFYVISSQYKEFFDVQYAYRSKNSDQINQMDLPNDNETIHDKSIDENLNHLSDNHETDKFEKIEESQINEQECAELNDLTNGCDLPQLPNAQNIENVKSDDIESSICASNDNCNGSMKFNISSFRSKFCPGYQTYTKDNPTTILGSINNQPEKNGSLSNGNSHCFT